MNEPLVRTRSNWPDRRSARSGWAGLSRHKYSDPLKKSVPLSLLTFAVFLAFALGGSSRADVEQLLILRPISMCLLGFACSLVHKQNLRAFAGLYVLAVFLTALIGMQLIPLPFSLWSRLPGRQLIVEIDVAARLGQIARPLTMVPAATLNAFWSLGLPLAVFVLATMLSPHDRKKALAWIAVIGTASALLGALQILGPVDGPLYFYRWTSPGLPVGFFANRNHQALFLACLIPLSWVLCRQYRWRLNRIALLAAFTLYAGLIFIVVLLTGSRAGLTATILAVASLSLLQAPASPDRAPNKSAKLAIGNWGWLVPVTFGALAALALIFGRALAVERLLGADAMADMRVRVLPTVLAMIGQYAPWGSGFGSFEAVYQVHEPDALLMPTYMNHAHNDWLELVLDGGLLAVALVVAFMALIIRRTWQREQAKAEADEIMTGRLGVIVLGLLAFGSIFDYPLRVPALACVFMLATVLACQSPSGPFEKESR